MPSVRTSRQASPAVPAIKAAQTSNRFAEPSVAASGAVTTPPTTRPITPPAAITGKKRFAWRVSATSPARPQTARMSVTPATFRTSQSAAYTHDAPASSAARLPSATTMMTAGMSRNARARPTRARRVATPRVVANIAIPTKAYMRGSFPTPYRAKNRASMALWAIMIPASAKNAIATRRATVRPSPR